VYHLQSLLASRLNRQHQHTEESRNEQTTTGIDRRLGVTSTRLNSNNRRAKTSNAVQETAHSSSSATDWGREDFRCVRVQDTVHDVLEESLETSESELEVGVGRDGEEEDEDTGDDGGDGHCALAAYVLEVDGVAGEDGSGDSDDGGDGVVAVDDADVVLDSATRVLEVLREESVEKWVGHTDSRPLEPE